MKVKELIAALSREDPEMQVHFAYNYGDHWRTQVAPAVSRVEPNFVKWSEYHSMDRLLSGDEDEDVADEVVVLR